MKKTLITGIIILLPIALTILLFVFLIDLFTNPILKILEPHLSCFGLGHSQCLIFVVRLIIFLFLLCLIFLLGVITRVVFFRPLITSLQKLLFRLPIVKTIYRASHEAIQGFLSLDKRKAFTEPVLIPFPTPKSYAIGFLSGAVPKECQEKCKNELLSVFVPSPHLISGYFLLIPKEHVYRIKMNNEEAVKYIISLGVITPHRKKKQKP